MRIARYRFRTTFRHRLGGYVAVALLVALLGGVALTSLLAARRTESSYPSFLRSTNPAGLLVQPSTNLSEQGADDFLDQIADLPHVKQWRAPSRSRRRPSRPKGASGRSCSPKSSSTRVSTGSSTPDLDRVHDHQGPRRGSASRRRSGDEPDGRFAVPPARRFPTAGWDRHHDAVERSCRVPQARPPDRRRGRVERASGAGRHRQGRDRLPHRYSRVRTRVREVLLERGV